MDAWQKCPVCSGSGQMYNYHSSAADAICNVCNGHGIINTITGQPPPGIKSMMAWTTTDVVINTEPPKQ